MTNAQCSMTNARVIRRRHSTSSFQCPAPGHWSLEFGHSLGIELVIGHSYLLPCECHCPFATNLPELWQQSADFRRATRYFMPRWSMAKYFVCGATSLGP